MIGATSSAPHICVALRFTAALNCSQPALSQTRTASSETRIQVPATAGANFHTIATG